MIRLKKDQICEVLVGFLRSFCKVGFLQKFGKDQERQRRIYLTRPSNLTYEKYIFSNYMQVLRFVQDMLDKHSTFEEDMELLRRGESDDQEPISFELRMAVIYRSEKKKILRSQINLI